MCKTIFEYNSEEKNDGRLLKYEEIVINQNKILREIAIWNLQWLALDNFVLPKNWITEPIRKPAKEFE